MAVITKKITLKGGEPFILPPNAEIVFVSDSNSLESDCAAIPSTGPLICYSYAWATEYDSGGGSGPWRVSQTNLIKYTLDSGIEFEFENMYANGDETTIEPPLNVNQTGFTLYEFLDGNENFPGQIISLKKTGNFGEVRYFKLVVKLPQVFGENSYLSFSGNGFNPESPGESAARIYATRCDECCGDILPEG